MPNEVSTKPTQSCPPSVEAQAIARELDLELKKLTESQESRFPRHIRRCFMNGKQCTMHSTGRESRSAPENPPDGALPSVFVAMPYRDNLDTFYDWSLKPFLREHCGIPEDNIRKADEYRNVGYVTCEKICRRIQEANLVVVDISTPNPNVFYELGLAIGLGRPLMVFCEENSPAYKNTDIAEALGLTRDQIIAYPSVGKLTVKNPAGKLQRVKLGRREVLSKPGDDSEKRDDKENQSLIPLIRPLLAPGAEKVQSTVGDTYEYDIPVPFGTAITSAIGVAIQIALRDPEVNMVMKAIGCDNAWKIAEAAKELQILDKQKRHESFDYLSKRIDRVFALVVDLGAENPFSYYWLGYCHARGINAIPVHRPLPRATEEDEDGEIVNNSVADKEIEERQGVLAFDIRALWYIPYGEKDKPTVLAKSLVSALTELFPRDLGSLQRSIFWERLTIKRKISIFTGAVHHRDLNREVVGDWDQRTVSELVRYLSQAGETVVTVLEKPVYAPETVEEKLKKATVDRDATLRSYVQLVHEELMNHPDCVIVASADVNPMTEVVLAKAYNLLEEICFREQEIKPPDHGRPPHHAVVALKGKSAKAWMERIKVGDAVRVHGVLLQACDNPVFMINALEIGEERYKLERQLTETIGLEEPCDGDRTETSLNGSIENIEELSLPGNLAKNKLLLLKLEGGRRIIVDLGTDQSTELSRYFSRYIPNELDKDSRGFMWGGHAYGTKYVSQDQASERSIADGGKQVQEEKPPKLLGHIVVLPNPFARGGTIVVLNGVSGPATFGLAEMLTGGAEESTPAAIRKKVDAERMLGMINSMWSAKGVEGLVRIDMGTMKSDNHSSIDPVRAKFYDQREVSGWDWYNPIRDSDINLDQKFPTPTTLSGDNPRTIRKS